MRYFPSIGKILFVFVAVLSVTIVWFWGIPGLGIGDKPARPTLVVDPVSNETALQTDPSHRATFSELTPEQQEVIDVAVQCTCRVAHSAFDPGNADWVSFVFYNDQWWDVTIENHGGRALTLNQSDS